MDKIEIKILDKETDNLHKFDLNEIDYFEEGTNRLNGKDTVLIVMKNGDKKAFEMTFDQFMNEVKRVIHVNGYFGMLHEYRTR
jgi:hypothetical protein